MQVIADLQIHSRFSRAVSEKMRLSEIAKWAKKKGIELIATGDWTHPIWFRELKANLIQVSEGVYVYKKDESARTVKIPDEKPNTKFILSTEISSIYSQGGKTRRIHTLIFAPNISVVERINKQFSSRGANLLSDGRPIMGLSAREVAEIALTQDERCLIIPSHAWTPWFSLYGSMSGFDSIDECFGDLSDKIYAIETGLSSDPAMNWRIAELENRSIISSSDAHSPQKIGREATVFELPQITYENIRKAIVGEAEDSKKTNRSKIAYTIEFYPEEGKYHYTGHRRCKIVYSPKEAKKMGTICPICNKKLTVGVMSRVESLAGSDVETESETDKYGVRWIRKSQNIRPPYVMLVPLMEIIAEAQGVGVGTKKVNQVYEQLISLFGSEFDVLLKTPIEEFEILSKPKITDGIKKTRLGDIIIKPGYDGVFGDVRIWKEEEIPPEVRVDQATLF